MMKMIIQDVASTAVNRMTTCLPKAPTSSIFKTASVSATTLSRLGSTSQHLVSDVMARTTNAYHSIPPSQARRYAKFGALAVGLGLAQYKYGTSSEDDVIFDHTFTTTKHPMDLADFYGTEDFMEVFCGFPVIVHLMMRQATFDEDGTCHAFGITGPGNLRVNIEFDEHEGDTTGDGISDTITYFNKRETFHEIVPSWIPVLGGRTVFHMIQNFGYQMLDDGKTCRIHHHGEKFYGLFPIRILFTLHSYYVIWATEKYVNNPAFGCSDKNNDDDEEDAAEAIRHNIPLHEFQVFLHNLIHQVEDVKRDATTKRKDSKHLEVTLQRLKTLSSKVREEQEQQENPNSALNTAAVRLPSSLSKRHESDTATSSSLSGKPSAQLLRPRLTTLKSRRTKLNTSMHLQVDDAEAKDTIQTALHLIGQEKRQEPVKVMRALSRRTSLPPPTSQGAAGRASSSSSNYDASS